ncbi:hypothetical protein DICVIV_13980 [Dictyocaulus viviparus]|uniref:Uncharacterized protein n=1 Tax=Dictyocaulus viviparus TaxID=29172 RepID=A0A0D8XC92_DICVI|nr:hypothetical protein DICVIV_13980 [Dictyocaulus viviparus]
MDQVSVHHQFWQHQLFEHFGCLPVLTMQKRTLFMLFLW